MYIDGLVNSFSVSAASLRVVLYPLLLRHATAIALVLPSQFLASRIVAVVSSWGSM